MSKNFVLRAAVCVVALMVATVVMEGQANACFKKLFGGRHKGGCCEAEATCGAPAEEASCGCPAVEESSCAAPAEASCAAPEPSCGCPVVEESCGCPVEEASCGCSSGHKKHRLFGRFRNRGGCGESSCEPSCGAPVEASCGCPVVEEAACGAPAEAAPADAETPPAPEAPAT